MLNYMLADLRRIFSKKLIYNILFGAGIAACALMFFAEGVTNIDGILNEAGTLCMLAGIFGGVYLFSVVYTDDLTAKTLPALIGFGMKRVKLILCKLIIFATLVTLMFSSIILVFILASAGTPMGNETQDMLKRLLLSHLLSTVGFGIVSSVVVYGTQKATLSLITFILLITDLVGYLLGEIFGKTVPVLKECLMSSITSKLILNADMRTVLPYLIYVAVFIVGSIFAFKKKELEF